MKRGFIIALILVLIIVIAVIIGIVIWSNERDDGSGKPPISEDNSCTELGCSSNTVYVGSINSDKYYECSCRWAKNINPENIVCFNSEQEYLHFMTLLRHKVEC